MGEIACFMMRQYSGCLFELGCGEEKMEAIASF